MEQVKPSYENQLLGDGFGAAEIFKQAAQEMALCFSSSWIKYGFGLNLFSGHKMNFQF